MIWIDYFLTYKINRKKNQVIPIEKFPVSSNFPPIKTNKRI
jgi:hypothetical protein